MSSIIRAFKECMYSPSELERRLGMPRIFAEQVAAVVNRDTPITLMNDVTIAFYARSTMWYYTGPYSGFGTAFNTKPLLTETNIKHFDMTKPLIVTLHDFDIYVHQHRNVLLYTFMTDMDYHGRSDRFIIIPQEYEIVHSGSLYKDSLATTGRNDLAHIIIRHIESGKRYCARITVDEPRKTWYILQDHHDVDERNFYEMVDGKKRHFDLRTLESINIDVQTIFI